MKNEIKVNENVMFDTEKEFEEFQSLFDEAIEQSSHDFKIILLTLCVVMALLGLLYTSEAKALDLIDDQVPVVLWCGDYGFDLPDANLTANLCNQIEAMDRFETMLVDQRSALEERVAELEGRTEDLEEENEVQARRLVKARKTIARLHQGRKGRK